MLNKAPRLYWVAVAVAVLAVWFLFFRTPDVVAQEFVLAPKPFLQQVSVSGKVVAASSVDLGFSQGGRISAVYTSVGARVAAGTTLAVIENGDQRAALLQRQAALEREEAKLSALRAGTRPEELAVAQADVESDLAALIDAIGDAYRAADSAVRGTLDQFIQNTRSLPSVTFQVSDSSIKALVESKRLTIETTLIEWAAANASLNTSSNVASAVMQAQANLAITSALLADASSLLNRAIATTQFPQATLDTYASSVATARTNINSAVAALTSAEAALQASVRTLALKKAGSTAQDIAAQEAQVKSAAADVAAAQAQLQKTIVSAPFSGTVTMVNAKVGKIVSPNEPEISMISAGAYQIESYIPEINVSLIQPGDKAKVTLDAYGDTLFGATVVSVDPAETVRDGVSTYRAVLQFDIQDPRIKSGMTANVVVTTEEKQDVLTVPQGLVVSHDGKKFVRIRVGEEVVEREVVLGAVSSLGEVEITSGLNSGDIVISTLP